MGKVGFVSRKSGRKIASFSYTTAYEALQAYVSARRSVCYMGTGYW
jgi:hypothetical protein